MLLHQHESYSHRSADKACFYLLLDFLAHFDYHNSPCNVRSNKKKLRKLISQQNFFSTWSDCREIIELHDVVCAFSFDYACS